MPRVKIPRKSTTVDMTAMCDVAFLLLTFFMLATKFKPDDPVKVKTPSSVSSDIVPDKNALQVLFDKALKARFTYNDPDNVAAFIECSNTAENLNLRHAGMRKLTRIVENQGIGVPIGSLKQLLDLDPDAVKEVKQPGIPMPDSAHNELRIWVSTLLKADGGKQPDNVLIKGDNQAKYPEFKEVIRAFTDNKVFHFKLVTSMSDAPVGSALWEKLRKLAGGK